MLVLMQIIKFVYGSNGDSSDSSWSQRYLSPDDMNVQKVAYFGYVPVESPL